VLSVSDVADQGLLDSLQGQLTTSVADWVGCTFGEAAGNALFSAGGQVAFAGEMLSTLMGAYTAVMIIVMIIQMIYSCEQSEYQLDAKKQLKVCHDLGSYCDKSSSILGLCLVRKESYCCYNSPLARILNEQIKPQLGLDFGTPQTPNCAGIKVSDLSRVNWNNVNLSE
jgi:conjugal transfer mating pair stabilization protein TraN